MMLISVFLSGGEAGRTPASAVRAAEVLSSGSLVDGEGRPSSEYLIQGGGMGYAALRRQHGELLDQMGEARGRIEELQAENGDIKAAYEAMEIELRTKAEAVVRLQTNNAQVARRKRRIISSHPYLLYPTAYTQARPKPSRHSPLHLAQPLPRLLKYQAPCTIHPPTLPRPTPPRSTLPYTTQPPAPAQATPPRPTPFHSTPFRTALHHHHHHLPRLPKPIPFHTTPSHSISGGVPRD